MGPLAIQRASAQADQSLRWVVPLAGYWLKYVISIDHVDLNDCHQTQYCLHIVYLHVKGREKGFGQAFGRFEKLKFVFTHTCGQ